MRIRLKWSCTRVIIRKVVSSYCNRMVIYEFQNMDSMVIQLFLLRCSRSACRSKVMNDC